MHKNNLKKFRKGINDTREQLRLVTKRLEDGRYEKAEELIAEIIASLQKTRDELRDVIEIQRYEK
ncbi:hypothetical protein OD098_003553 [Salmonella enterica]|nr:hypothetical protein [Salmonella enterica]EJX3319325.1 hypothetical protein [Salmonella enterica]EJX4927345.1 hypothetical protein [Salmonella enterica]ELG7087872.1 hypothetical protein [Salmonella enterica]ELL0619389.1 hypothetical protein [Salmonella enterica]